MRPLNWILIALAGIVAMLLIGVLVVTQWVNPNVFKPRIVAALAAATGRPVALPGDLELAWYPWLALRTGEGSLGNPPALAGPPLLQWREARIGARLWPLLRGELVLDRLRIDGLDLRLRRDASGRANWDGLADAGGEGGQPLTLAGLDLRGARVGYIDDADDSRLLFENLELETGAWTAGQTAPVEIEAGFDLSFGGQPLLQQARLTTRVALPAPDGAAAGARAAPAASAASDTPLLLALGSTSLAARVQLPDLAPAGVPVSLDLPTASLDLDRSAYRAPSMQVAVGAARLGLRDLTYEQPGEAPPRAATNFSLAPTSLRALLVVLGIEAPVTADPRALESLAAEGRIALVAGSLTVEPLRIVLDETTLVGRVQRGGTPPEAEFTLAGDTMNIDRYLEPDEVESEPFKFPGPALGALRARGTLTLERATFDDLSFEGLIVRLLLDEEGLRGDAAAPRASEASGELAAPSKRAVPGEATR